ncbi:VOC family protein [Micromonospora inositola]|uniref:Glyoxalase-like domain-containing protein n=1 Tax=Micromonospora inositola TaxID=47865 RepID=A0A1C5IUG3_9ACTN|nr:VOC family protein [Micromonospora inositola]SCG61955.1 Glyoxalase-like domain-containing protein [Micromonospora inositola]
MEWQLVIDCREPSRLVGFWAEALRYRPQPPPDGHATWRDWYLSIGIPPDELGDGDCLDRLEDPTGAGPRIWFQPVPEPKSMKNRLHIDLKVGGGRAVPLPERRSRVDAEATRLVDLGARVLGGMDAPENDHYSVQLADPEGNEFCVV